MALTKRTLGYLVIAYTFIFLSLALRTPWLTIFALPVAILLFASVRLPATNPNPLSVSRQIQPGRSVGGEDVTVTLTVTNTSPHTIHSFQIEDRLPNQLKIGGGTNRLVLSLRDGETTRFQYQISNPSRGGYDIGPTTIRLWDSLALRTVKIQLTNVDELIVLPRMEKLGIVDLKSRRFGPWPGLVPSKRIGIGTEFFELAPYVPGDDLRRVNWKASARSGTLVTNEFEGEQVIDVLVVLDCPDVLSSQLFEYNALEFQVSFAASLCSQLITQGNRVGLSIYGAVRTWVAPAFGKRHLLRLLDSLALVKAGPATLPIKYVLESVVSTILPARSLIILVSPLIDDDVVGMIENIAKKGYSIVCFAPNPRSNLQGLSESAKVAIRLFAAERNLRMNRAKDLAVMIQLSPNMPVKPMLRTRPRWSIA
jgi:uncharacterized repeat protein (TIGR01451 family)